MHSLLKKATVIIAMLAVGGSSASASPISSLNEGKEGHASSRSQRVHVYSHEKTSTGTSFSTGKGETPDRYEFEGVLGGLRIAGRLAPVASWYFLRNGVMSLRDALPGETSHVRVEIRSDSDGRFVPDLRAYVSVKDAETKEDLLTSVPLLHFWGKESCYYGTNLSLPGVAPGQVKKVLVLLEIAPLENVARDAASDPNFLVAPVAMTFGPLSVPLVVDEETSRTASSAMRVATKEGRHPPVEPTPYPGRNAKK
jgi:hypothetical protein